MAKEWHCKSCGARGPLKPGIKMSVVWKRSEPAPVTYITCMACGSSNVEVKES